MLTSRAWIISSGLVGAISLMLRSAFNFSVTGFHFSLPTLNPLFIIINGIIFALAASSSLFGHGSEEHNHDHDTYHHYEHDEDNHNQNHAHDRSWNNSSSDYSFDHYNNNKVHKEEKVTVRPESGGSFGNRRPVSSPEIHSPSKAPEKPTGLTRPPTAPVKTFPQDDKSGDESETMDEMWKRVKAEKLPTKPNTAQSHVISRNDSRMSTSSCPSPSQSRRTPPSSSGSGKKLMERIPSWVNLKKELSMGRDELNSRVEAFIRKFNDEMKLQRLESLRRYKLFRRRSEDK